jgi:hypothetical protein
MLSRELDFGLKLDIISLEIIMEPQYITKKGVRQQATSERLGSCGDIPFSNLNADVESTIQNIGKEPDQKPRLTNRGFSVCGHTAQKCKTNNNIGNSKMAILEIMKEEQVEGNFNNILSGIRSKGLSPSKPTIKDSALNLYLEEYPTLKSAEAELTERYQKTQKIHDKKAKQNKHFVKDLTKLIKLDHEIMMLEMTVDFHYRDWAPEGSELSDFSIGTIFRTGSGRWLCTDIGSRTVVAIRYTPSNVENMEGPPYVGVETVFDEFDLGGITVL